MHRRILLLSFVWGFVPAPASGQLVPVATGFVYTEGPAADALGNVFFTDYKDGGGKIYRYGTDGTLTLVATCTGRANGLQVDAAGHLLACRAQGRVSRYDPVAGTWSDLADRHRGRRFNAPNDLVQDEAGGIWFTDPYFESPVPPPQLVAALYYLRPDGTVRRHLVDWRQPNGLALSADGQTLFVVSSLRAEVRAFAVPSPGILGPGRTFCRLRPAAGAPVYRGGDGCTLDPEGNLYVASAAGVQIFDACGRLRKTLPVPQRPANVALGGPADSRRLFVTAGTTLYAAELSRVLACPADPE